MSAGVITGLHDCRVNAGEGNQLLGVGEAIDIADFTQDNRTGCRTNARYGEDDGIDLFQLLLDLLIDFVDLVFSVVDLFDQDPNLESEGIGCQIKSTGRFGCCLELLSFDSAVMTSAGLFKQVGSNGS